MHRSAALGIALLCACSFPGPPTLLPPGFGPDPANPEAPRFFFPTGIAIDSASKWLVVVNSNTDRQYDAGAMYSFKTDVLLTYFAAAVGTKAFPEGELVGKAMTGNFTGPLVLAGQLGGQGLSRALTYPGYDTAPTGEPIPVPAIATSSKHPAGWVEPVPGAPLAFRTVGQQQNVNLVPLYRLSGERYAVYWKVSAKAV